MGLLLVDPEKVLIYVVVTPGDTKPARLGFPGRDSKTHLPTRY